MYPYHIAILQSISILGEAKAWEIIDVSGYAKGTFYRCICNLKFKNIVEINNNLYRLTEKGKIILALLKGQQAKRTFTAPPLHHHP